MHLIFDLDGTLIDSESGIRNSLIHAISSTSSFAGFDQSLIKIGPPLDQLIAEACKTEDKEVIAAISAAFKTHYDEVGYKSTKLYVDVRDVLEELALRHTLYVVTNKRSRPTQKILGHLRIEKFFDHVYCIDYQNLKWKKAGLIAKLLSELRLSSDNCVYIGDTFDDFVAATENHMKFMHAIWCEPSPEIFSEHCLTAPQDLLVF